MFMTVTTNNAECFAYTLWMNYETWQDWSCPWWMAI